MNKQYVKQQEKLMSIRQEVVEQCVKYQGTDKSCDNISTDNFCMKYPVPATFWRMGGCPLATHVKFDQDQSSNKKVRAGQQKQKKKR